MYWKVSSEGGSGVADPGVSDGRFVLHRHRDLDGPHLDLRLEQDGVLVGWRIDTTSLSKPAWATEKRPHSLVWMETGWRRGARGRGNLCLAGARRHAGAAVVARATRHPCRHPSARQEGLAPHTIRGIHTTSWRATASQPRLRRGWWRTGLPRGQRACERLCGLGRELDGSAFDEGVWRRALSGLSLDEIHTQLRSFEVRFDGKYPPMPVSRPERLPDTGDEGGQGEARGHGCSRSRGTRHFKKREQNDGFWRYRWSRDGTGADVARRRRRERSPL